MKVLYYVVLSLALILTLFSLACSDKDSNPVKDKVTNGVIDADNANIQYVGRFDRTDPKKAVFDWSGVYIRAKFEGTSCSLRLVDGNNYYAVTIDNGNPQVLKTDTATVYSVATGLADTIHTILIEKRTEAFVGQGEFLGFILDKGKDLLSPNPAPERRIEIIGNSMTCGYGVEGLSASEPFKNETENAALSYAALVGKALNADYQMVAYSGKGVVRNYGDANKTSAEPMPSVYDRTCYNNATRVWDFTKWIPQVVIINLGTNDFSTQPYPDKAVFQDAYTQLINRVQSNYAGVTIFCVCGPMIGSPCSTYIQEVVTQCQANNTNKAVYYIGMSTSLLTGTDRGSDWHPNISGQQKIANAILPVIKDRMGW
ncbi:MAG TPA: SGNH/GDSL hydrolase family protein [bacterium]|nr:SGNH/GDSL hydrolase family protein [bacterium]HPN42033.1 SGNH/GDSL hydrolase family protein [bacterium]